MALNGRRDDGNQTSLNDERSVPNRDSAEHDDAARGNKGSDDFGKLNVREGHSMNSIDLEDAINDARSLMARHRKTLTHTCLDLLACMVLGELTVWSMPRFAAFCFIVALVKLGFGVSQYLAYRSARIALDSSRDGLAVLKRAEWIALCERINRDRTFTRSGASVACSPKDAA